MDCARWLTGWSGHSKVACSCDCDVFPSLTIATQNPTWLSRRSRKSSLFNDPSRCSSPTTAFIPGLSSIKRTMSSTLQTTVPQTPITTLTPLRRCVTVFLRAPRSPVVVNRHRQVPERTRNRDCLNRLPRALPPSTLTLTHAKTLGHARGLTMIESTTEIPSSARPRKPT